MSNLWTKCIFVKFGKYSKCERKGMQMKKKLLALMMTVLMTVSLSGCGNDIIVDVVTNDDVEMSGQDITNDTKETQEEKAEVAETNPAGLKTIPIEDVKVGICT